MNKQIRAASNMNCVKNQVKANFFYGLAEQ